MSPYCPSERRVWARHVTDRKTLCLSEVDTEQMLWAAVIQSISREGIQLRFKRSFEAGTFLKLDLPIDENGNSLSVRAQVLHARRLLDEQWEVGCMFMKELTNAELNSFLKAVFLGWRARPPGGHGSLASWQAFAQLPKSAHDSPHLTGAQPRFDNRSSAEDS